MMRSTTAYSVIKAISFILPPHRGQSIGSDEKDIQVIGQNRLDIIRRGDPASDRMGLNDPLAGHILDNSKGFFHRLLCVSGLPFRGHPLNLSLMIEACCVTLQSIDTLIIVG